MEEIQSKEEQRVVKKRKRRCGGVALPRKVRKQKPAIPPLITTYTECVFCKQGKNDEYGTFFSNPEEKIAAHLFCLEKGTSQDVDVKDQLFSAGLPQRGADDEGFDGFLIPDIFKEANRAQKITCKHCNQFGASSGCTVKTCRQTYHLQCGLEKNIQFQFLGNFNTYCPHHRDYQDLSFLHNATESSLVCPLCLDSVNTGTDNSVILKMPCCRNKFAHSECIQHQAYSSGYFFKCPFCNNEKDFQEEMAKFGIYIPQRDAAWEEANAFSDLLQQYSKCDWPQCKCVWGRTFSDEEKWEFLRCLHCGQSAVHRKCLGNVLASPSDDYVCPVCSDATGSNNNLITTTTVLSRSCDRDTEHQRRMEELRMRDDPILLSHPEYGPDMLRRQHGVQDCTVKMERLPSIILESLWRRKIKIQKYSLLMKPFLAISVKKKKTRCDDETSNISSIFPSQEEDIVVPSLNSSHGENINSSMLETSCCHGKLQTDCIKEEDMKIKNPTDTSTTNDQSCPTHNTNKDTSSSSPATTSFFNMFRSKTASKILTVLGAKSSPSQKRAASQEERNVNSKRLKLGIDMPVKSTGSDNNNSKLRVKFQFKPRNSSLSISTNPSKSVSYTDCEPQKELPSIKTFSLDHIDADEKNMSSTADEKPEIPNSSSAEVVADEKPAVVAATAAVAAERMAGKLDIFRPKTISEYYHHSISNNATTIKATATKNTPLAKIKPATYKTNSQNSLIDSWLRKVTTTSTPINNNKRLRQPVDKTPNHHTENSPPDASSKSVACSLSSDGSPGVIESTPQVNRFKSILTSVPPLNYSQLNYNKLCSPERRTSSESCSPPMTDDKFGYQ